MTFTLTSTRGSKQTASANSFPFNKVVCFMGLTTRCFREGEILVGVKESEKPAVINPKGKLLIDPNIKWDKCELIIMYKNEDSTNKEQQLPAQRRRSKSDAPPLRHNTKKTKAVSPKQKKVKELLGETSVELYVCNA